MSVDSVNANLQQQTNMRHCSALGTKPRRHHESFTDPCPHRRTASVRSGPAGVNSCCRRARGGRHRQCCTQSEAPPPVACRRRCQAPSARCASDSEPEVSHRQRQHKPATLQMRCKMRVLAAPHQSLVARGRGICDGVDYKEAVRQELRGGRLISTCCCVQDRA